MPRSSLVLVAAALTLASTGLASTEPPIRVASSSITLKGVVATPKAPHGACFSPDGRLAYIACAGDDTIAVLDLEKMEIIRQIDAPSTPLDVALTPEGDALLITQFGADAVVRVSLSTGEITATTVVGRGPSLFSGPAKRGRRYLVSEFAGVVTEIAPDGSPERSWKTGAGPYPGAVTDDGILLFVPGRTDGSVTVIDTLNSRVAATTPVGTRPEGGSVTSDGVSYMVAVAGDNEIALINTATFEVTSRITGVGPRPFSVLSLGDGIALVNNAGGSTVSVIDERKQKVVGEIEVGEMPIVMRIHPDGNRALVMCEGANHVAMLDIKRQIPEPADTPTEVVVLGMIHSAHRTSEKYSLDLVREIIRTIEPDEILVELPPNRFDAAIEQWQQDKAITEARTIRFPEYIDVIFPLLDEMDFTIIPTAGWTAEMNNYRNATLSAIASDPARSEQWDEYRQAGRAFQEELAKLGGSDDPLVIHSEAYDAAVKRNYGGPYNTYFNDDLADGGWDNINAKHYGHIADRLDEIRGQGKRVLITYGAAHKGWFLRELRERPDVTVLDTTGFIQRVLPASDD